MSISIFKQISLKRLILSLVIFLTLFSPKQVSASSQFDTSFSSLYNLTLDGQTQVTHTIKITNKLAHLYTTEYTIQLGKDNIENIVVMQDNSPLSFTRSKLEQDTILTLPKLNPVIGQDQSTTLTISYLTPNLTESLGQTFSLNIPRLSRANETKTFSRTVLLPPQLGMPSAQFPPSTSTSIDETTQKTKLVWNGYPNSNISLLFGDSQPYQLELEFEINNPSLSAADTEISLPPDTPYQKVYLSSLEPSPREIKLDQSGNWLAIYPLKSKEVKKINATLFVEVFPLPTNPIYPPLNNLEDFTHATHYWDKNDSAIKDLSTRLKTPENIYNYLVDNYVYDYSRANSGSARRLASEVLENTHSTICTDFTDSFIALARAQNIPANQIIGYGWSNDPELQSLALGEDVLHTWPSYYDQASSLWLQLDPTWSNTTGKTDYLHKLDFNHIAFTIHGIEDDYPLPAGSYKQSAKQKTISVKLAESLPEQVNNLQVDESKEQVVVKNLGNTSVLDPEYGYLPPQGQLIITTPIIEPSLLPRLLPYLVLVIILVLVFALLHKLKKIRYTNH